MTSNDYVTESDGYVSISVSAGSGNYGIVLINNSGQTVMGTSSTAVNNLTFVRKGMTVKVYNSNNATVTFKPLV